jgi:quaternary ammonium compound-resistance protein SugE
MSHSAAWLLLIASGMLDVFWAVSVKYAEGYTRLGWSILSLLLLVAFIALLGHALKVLPLGTAYAVWTGIGALGSLGLGIMLFGETLDPLRIGSAVLVLGGIVGLKLAG